MNLNSTPYLCHLFICANDRHGECKACADDGVGPALKARLKDEVAQRGWKGRVRVSQSGCLGLCAKGPNVMIYPQGIWFSGARIEDADVILAKVAEILG